MVLFRVVRVRIDGRRRARAEVAADAGVVGDMLVEFVAPQPWERHVKQAVLFDAQWGRRPHLLPPLREPELITVSARAFLLRGVELDALSGAEHVQEWWVRFVPDEALRGR